MNLKKEATEIVSEMIQEGIQNALEIYKNAERISEEFKMLDYTDNYEKYMGQGNDDARYAMWYF